MQEHEVNEVYKREVEKRFKHLSEYIQNIKDPDEKLASIAFCIANLVLQNCNEIEALGLLEKVKDLLIDETKLAKPPKQLARLSYIA